MRARSTLSLLLCAIVLAASMAARAADDPWQKAVSVDVSEMRLGEAVAQLLKNTGLSYAVDPGIRDAQLPKLYFKDVPLRQAMDSLVKIAGAVYRVDGDIVLIAMKPGNTDPLLKRVNLEAKDLPLSQVIDTLFKDTGLSYTVDPGIGQLRVTAVLKNVSFEVALKQVTKAAGVVYSMDGGTYAFSLRPFEVGYGGYGRTVAPQPENAVVEKIGLQFVEPPDVIPMLQMGGDVQLLSAGPSFVMIRGSEDGIEKAKKTIRMLDTPDALPQAVRIKLTAKVTVQGQGKPAKTYEASTESVGAAGSPMPLQIAAASGKRPGPQGEGGGPLQPQENSVQAVLVPVVDSQGKISLSGNGNVRGDLPFHYEKGFEVAVAALAGQKAVIAAGSAELDAGKVDFEVAVTATVEKERVRRPMGRPEPGFQPGTGGFAPPGAPGGPANPPPGVRPPGQPGAPPPQGPPPPPNPPPAR